MRRPFVFLCAVLLFGLATGVYAQQPIYKITVNVVERTTPAINYQHRSGATAVDFKGTPLLPNAHGVAEVESKQGYIKVEAKFDDLEPANRFGPEYLTYVLWAVTPEGRATNLGEIILNGNDSKLNVTTDNQAFGLIVTAEPYFAVTQPSDVVVMENTIRRDTVGKIEQIDAKYELLQRGLYVANVTPADLKPIPLSRNIPLDLYEARNAIRIADWADADRDAADTFRKASSLLDQAEKNLARKQSRKSISQLAREAVQTAEDARLIAMKRQSETRAQAERDAAAAREAQAKAAENSARAEAALEAQRRIQAEQNQQLEAERRARAEAERSAAESQARLDVARAESQARLDAERAARERDSIKADADRARQAAAQAELEKQQLRLALVDQLNKILETRDTARGLVVNLSDVLFDTGKYTLKPGAREKLAKVGGILLAHPGLSIKVEGHTDSVGSDEYNQVLSEHRASAVRDYLIQQGIASANVTAAGMGENYPVADNGSAAGRQQNRRVEMIVAGEVIGVPLDKSTSR